MTTTARRRWPAHRWVVVVMVLGNLAFFLLFLGAAGVTSTAGDVLDRGPSLCADAWGRSQGRVGSDYPDPGLDVGFGDDHTLDVPVVSYVDGGERRTTVRCHVEVDGSDASDVRVTDAQELR